MVILITGANGQLGKDFQKLFMKKDMEFIPTDLDVDITDLEGLRVFSKKKKITVIINCAAYNEVDNAEKEWKHAYRVNGIGSRNLALIANEINAEFINYSSDYVFDGKKGSPYGLLDVPRPISRYGESKLLGEQFTQNLAKRYFLIRVSWVFGEGNVNFVKKVIGWSKDNSQFSIVDDQISSPTYTLDLAKITLDLLESGGFGLYHITNSDYCSRYEWAKYILKKLNWQGEIKKVSSESFETQARRPKYSVLDNFGIKETVGYELPRWTNATDRFLKELSLI